MRRSMLISSIVISIVIVFVAGGRLTGTTAQEGADPVFAGSWRVAVTPAQGPPLVTLSTYGADSTVLSSALPVQQPPPGAPGGVIFAGTAHGAWAATTAGSANVTFVELRANGQGEPLGTISVRAAISLDAGAEPFNGAFVLTVADPAGNPLATSAGTIAATRIVAEPPEEAPAP